MQVLRLPRATRSVAQDDRRLSGGGLAYFCKFVTQMHPGPGLSVENGRDGKCVRCARLREARAGNPETENRTQGLKPSVLGRCNGTSEFVP